MKLQRTKTNAQKNKYPKRLFSILNSMKKRCYNENHISYKDYGGRGITICDEWLKETSNFYEWAINNGYSDELSIDRINHNGNYEPSNCRWANKKIQARNMSNNHLITHNNETHCIAEWAEILNVHYDVVRRRWQRGTFYKLFIA